ncbi:hypothetical protein H9P43_004153 [Blastocladiella emersonii ATCC 22665]|nr:hypothetical protein H9P43_004153 [Blastocladiella emersonii ATCC 22665]
MIGSAELARRALAKLDVSDADGAPSHDEGATASTPRSTRTTEHTQSSSDDTKSISACDCPSITNPKLSVISPLVQGTTVPFTSDVTCRAEEEDLKRRLANLHQRLPMAACTPVEERCYVRKHGYLPIENYGLIGNMRTAALVSTDASVDFMCFPKFDSPSLFGRLLDDQKGGFFQIVPRHSASHKQQYLPNSNVLVTRFLADKGASQVTDFFHLPDSTRESEPSASASATAANGGVPSARGPSSIPGASWFSAPFSNASAKPLYPWLIRILEAVRGTVEFEVTCCPAFRYGLAEHSTFILPSSPGDDNDELPANPRKRAASRNAPSPSTVVFNSPDLVMDLRCVQFEPCADSVPGTGHPASQQQEPVQWELVEKPGCRGPGVRARFSLKEGQQVWFVFRERPRWLEHGLPLGEVQKDEESMDGGSEGEGEDGDLDSNDSLMFEFDADGAESPPPQQQHAQKNHAKSRVSADDNGFLSPSPAPLRTDATVADDGPRWCAPETMYQNGRRSFDSVRSVDDLGGGLASPTSDKSNGSDASDLFLDDTRSAAGKARSRHASFDRAVNGNGNVNGDGDADGRFSPSPDRYKDVPPTRAAAAHPPSPPTGYYGLALDANNLPPALSIAPIDGKLADTCEVPQAPQRPRAVNPRVSESVPYYDRERERADPPLAIPLLQSLLRQTLRFWQRWISHCTYKGRWRESVHRSAFALKLLTYEPTGAVIAAATFSLPEEVCGNRNWDYRYCWIRDSAFVTYAFIRLGLLSEARNYIRFIELVCKNRNPDGGLQVMYTIEGHRDIPELELTHLEGYRGSRPVRIGNAASSHLQLDIYGALLDSIYLMNKFSSPVGIDMWVVCSQLVNFVCRNWRRPDMSIWEVRGTPMHFVYSKVMCWVAVDRGLRLAEKRVFPCPDRDMWTATRDAIYLEILEKGWNKDGQYFQQAYENPVLDSSVLIMPLVFFMSPTDPRMLSTMAAILRVPEKGGLTSNNLVHRYLVNVVDDGLKTGEGSFTMCTFWLIECLCRAGRYVPKYLARALYTFDQTLAYGNHLLLFSEEISTAGELAGNFPQAFTHIALISSAFNLDRVLGHRSGSDLI